MFVLLCVLMLSMGFGLWYLLYGLECFMNGGSIGRNQFTMPFSLFWQEFLWILPGGRRRKADFIKMQMGDSEEGSMCGMNNSWDYREIREKDLYAEVGDDMLPGFWHFAFIHVFIPLMPLIALFGIIEMVHSIGGK